MISWIEPWISTSIPTSNKKKYDYTSMKERTIGGRNLKQILDQFVWLEDVIDYVRKIRPYSGCMNWIWDERITLLINKNNIYFLTVEVLLHEGNMKVCDCKLMCLEHDMVFIFIQHVFELLQSQLRQSGIINHFEISFSINRWN